MLLKLGAFVTNNILKMKPCQLLSVSWIKQEKKSDKEECLVT